MGVIWRIKTVRTLYQGTNCCVDELHGTVRDCRVQISRQRVFRWLVLPSRTASELQTFWGKGHGWGKRQTGGGTAAERAAREGTRWTQCGAERFMRGHRWGGGLGGDRRCIGGGEREVRGPGSAGLSPRGAEHPGQASFERLWQKCSDVQIRGIPGGEKNSII